MKVWKATSCPWWGVAVMRKLMTANLRKLVRDKYLWIICAVCMVMCTIGAADDCKAVPLMAARGLVTEDFLYLGGPMLGVFLGVFVSLFLGTEHSDGTLRNKVTVGRTRSSIYLTSFLTCFLGSLLLLLFWFVGSFAFLPMSGLELQYGWGRVCLIIVLLVGTLAVFSAIYTLIGNLCSNKSMTVVYSLAAFGAIFLVSNYLYSWLGEQEFASSAMLPNPRHLSGSLREICQALLELLPVGQLILIAYNEVVHPARMLLFSLSLAGILLLVGLFSFQKKDLK